MCSLHIQQPVTSSPGNDWLIGWLKLIKHRNELVLKSKSNVCLLLFVVDDDNDNVCIWHAHSPRLDMNLHTGTTLSSSGESELKSLWFLIHADRNLKLSLPLKLFQVYIVMLFLLKIYMFIYIWGVYRVLLSMSNKIVLLSGVKANYFAWSETYLNVQKQIHTYLLHIMSI